MARGTKWEAFDMIGRKYREAYEIAKAAGEDEAGCLMAARWMGFRTDQFIQKTWLDFSEDTVANG